jgi:hypothetical protein
MCWEMDDTDECGGEEDDGRGEWSEERTWSLLEEKGLLRLVPMLILRNETAAFSRLRNQRKPIAGV